MDDQRLDDQLEPIYNNSVPIQDVVWKNSWERWTIETGAEKRSGRSVLAAWHDDNEYKLTNISLVRKQNYKSEIFNPFCRLIGRYIDKVLFTQWNNTVKLLILKYFQSWIQNLEMMTEGPNSRDLQIYI